MKAEEFWNRVDSMKGDAKLSEIAEVIGIPYQRIKNQRSNVQFPKLSDAYLIAKYLGTSIEHLLTGEDEPPVVNKCYESELLAKIREEDPRLFKFIISEFGYNGAMKKESDPKEEGRA